MKLRLVLSFLAGAIVSGHKVDTGSSSASFAPTNKLEMPSSKKLRNLHMSQPKPLLETDSNADTSDDADDATAQYEPTPSPRTRPTSSRNTQIIAAPKSKHLDFAICLVYFCNVFALTLPVILLPMISAESKPGMPPASFAAAVASVATLGGACGKFVNGFVCQFLGGRNSAFLYLLGIASAAFLVSTISDNFGIAFGAIEFFASMQWTACSVVLANHYQNDAAGLSKAISVLAFSSTAGIISCKAVGTALLQYLSWRRVAQIGSMIALTGSLIMRGIITEHPALAKAPPRQPFNLNSVLESFRAVLGSRIFWVAGMAHATTLLVRASDKILGSFFQEVTSLPRKRSVVRMIYIFCCFLESTTHTLFPVNRFCLRWAHNDCDAWLYAWACLW